MVVAWEDAGGSVWSGGQLGLLGLVGMRGGEGGAEASGVELGGRKKAEDMAGGFGGSTDVERFAPVGMLNGAEKDVEAGRLEVSMEAGLKAGVGGGAEVIGKASIYCKDRCESEEDGKSEVRGSKFQSGGSEGSGSVKSIRSMASASSGGSSKTSMPEKTPSGL